MKQEILKIRTKKGKIITLTVTKKTITHYVGFDKFNAPVILPIEDIDELFRVVE